MARLNVLNAAVAGFALACASLAWFAHAQNTRIEESRIVSLNLSELLITADRGRGETIAWVGGCIACHTNVEQNGAMLGGGVRLESAYGTFVSPNISSDPVEGIGLWSVDMLGAALLNGRSPDDSHYWPAFPYPAYATMTGQDIADLYIWLQSSAPAAVASQRHDLLVPEFTRVALSLWKALYVPANYRPGVFVDRGQYLVEGPGHCAACHAQRDLFGGIADRQLTGNNRGPDGSQVPGITASALQDWTEEDLVFFLEIGMTPEGDFTGGHMAAVIEHGTAHLSANDLRAMALYLKSSSNAGAL
jgi:mono/diheme cytochrome c family protein